MNMTESALQAFGVAFPKTHWNIGFGNGHICDASSHEACAQHTNASNRARLDQGVRCAVIGL